MSFEASVCKIHSSLIESPFHFINEEAQHKMSCISDRSFPTVSKFYNDYLKPCSKCEKN